MNQPSSRFDRIGCHAPVFAAAVGLLLVSCFLQVAQAVAGEYALVVDAARTGVTFTLKATAHTVEGTAPVSEASIHVDPVTGAASGRVVLKAADVTTGNGMRDTAMRADVLEADKYPLIVFQAEKIVGNLLRTGKSNVEVHGLLSIHGADHPVVLPTVVAVDGAALDATATLDIPFVQWGMQDPSNWLLKVADTVTSKIEISGTVTPAP